MRFRTWLEATGPTLRFVDDHMDTIGGGYDAEHKYLLLAYDADEGGKYAVGGIEYTVLASEPSRPHIDFIQVRKERRRQGIGEQLMNWLAHKYGGYHNLNLGGYATDDGQKLVDKMARMNPPKDGRPRPIGPASL